MKIALKVIVEPDGETIVTAVFDANYRRRVRREAGMKINYTKPQGGGKGDALTIIFKPDASYDEPEEIAEGVHAHHDHEGNVTAIEFYENASGKVDLSRLDISGLSLKTQEAHFA